jgi:hypothetical protein
MDQAAAHAPRKKAPSNSCFCRGVELLLCDATHWKSKTPALGQGGWELIPGFTVEHATLALLVPAAPLFEEKCHT